MATLCIVLYYSVSINLNVERVKKEGRGFLPQTEAFSQNFCKAARHILR